MSKILLALLIINLIVSAAALSYMVSLAGVSAKISEIVTAEKNLAAALTNLSKTMGAYRATISEIQKRISSLEETVKPKPIILGTTDKITVLDPAKCYDFYIWEVFNNI